MSISNLMIERPQQLVDLTLLTEVNVNQFIVSPTKVPKYVRTEFAD
jgi:hypothetical protein